MFSGVLNERHAIELRYDAASDTATVVVARAEGKSASRTQSAELLLDARGFLVGVDVGAEGEDRVVVMVGPHECVNHTKAAKVVVVEADGDVSELRIADARAACRAHEPNPYAR